ncbi:hypothetical protein SmJEL517_g01416 [Synchytrium microbalum]|uniref:Velvet domain-containing protein n=1 Tax=Synchytrium microbalum TaxID=1806994 RepID=A0A507C980_9FUNG|nr:uncharacterized protein SmJEL517_g01416 [Synchytrium microbalum]TPX36152.1 hypothetical protein SmJEL517_g01416 [Synchytrium microbalum]
MSPALGANNDDKSSQYTFVNLPHPRARQTRTYHLVLRQQPKHSRMCGFGEKVDRRPVDPPPIVQLEIQDASTNDENAYLYNPYYFMYASLVSPDSEEELHLLRDGKTRSTTGSIVSSLYRLKDVDSKDGGFFVFPDLSVRMEGAYRLKFSLFEIIAAEIFYCASIISDIFNVYPAKKFPGMEESTLLSRAFAEQGLKIRIRKELRMRKGNKREPSERDESPVAKKKSRKKGGAANESDGGSESDDELEDMAPYTYDTSQPRGLSAKSSGSDDPRFHKMVNAFLGPKAQDPSMVNEQKQQQQQVLYHPVYTTQASNASIPAGYPASTIYPQNYPPSSYPASTGYPPSAGYHSTVVAYPLRASTTAAYYEPSLYSYGHPNGVPSTTMPPSNQTIYNQYYSNETANMGNGQVGNVHPSGQGPPTGYHAEEYPVFDSRSGPYTTTSYASLQARPTAYTYMTGFDDRALPEHGHHMSTQQQQQQPVAHAAQSPISPMPIPMHGPPKYGVSPVPPTLLSQSGPPYSNYSADQLSYPSPVTSSGQPQSGGGPPLPGSSVNMNPGSGASAGGGNIRGGVQYASQPQQYYSYSNPPASLPPPAPQTGRGSYPAYNTASEMSLPPHPSSIARLSEGGMPGYSSGYSYGAPPNATPQQQQMQQQQMHQQHQQEQQSVSPDGFKLAPIIQSTLPNSGSGQQDPNQR